MELSTNICNVFKPFTIFIQKRCILDVWLDSEYVYRMSIYISIELLYLHHDEYWKNKIILEARYCITKY